MGVRRPLPTLLVLLALAACGDGTGDDPGSGGTPPADTAPSGETAGADSVRIVLVPGPLRVHPADGAAAVTDVAAGTTLRATGDTTAGSDRWVRLSTWDDRTGWMPRTSVLDAGLWSHYSNALGGVALVALRPAYPASGRWVAEAPFPSPDLDPPAEAWLVGDSLLHARVTGRDTMRLECIDARHSLAVLDGPGRSPEGPGARLEKAMLAIPSAREPAARALAVTALDPESELREVVETAARAALEAGPPGGVPDHADAPPPDAGTEPLFDWRSVGPDAAWAVAYWNPHEGEGADISPGRWGTALLAVRTGDAWTVRTVLPLAWTFAGPTAPPWRLVSAVATVPDRPTLLAVEVVEYEGARIDLHLADDAGFQRFYRGFYWGC